MATPSSATPVRGEVWRIRFDPSVGAEIQKQRPAAVGVPAAGRLPLRVVVPITDWKPVYAGFPWFVYLAVSPQKGLTKELGADAFQVKSVALSRFDQRLGSLTDDEIDRIAAAIALCAGYVPPAAPYALAHQQLSAGSPRRAGGRGRSARRCGPRGR